MAPKNHRYLLLQFQVSATNLPTWWHRIVVFDMNNGYEFGQAAFPTWKSRPPGKPPKCEGHAPDARTGWIYVTNNQIGLRGFRSHPPGQNARGPSRLTAAVDRLRDFSTDGRQIYIGPSLEGPFLGCWWDASRKP